MSRGPGVTELSVTIDVSAIALPVESTPPDTNTAPLRSSTALWSARPDARLRPAGVVVVGVGFVFEVLGATVDAELELPPPPPPHPAAAKSPTAPASPTNISTRRRPSKVAIKPSG